MDDDLFEFEAPQEALPALNLGTKKKKKKKKKDTESSTLANSELPSLDLSKDKKKKKKKSKQPEVVDTSSGFAALNIDDDDDHDVTQDNDEGQTAIHASTFAALDMGLDGDTASAAEDEEEMEARVVDKKKKKKKKKKPLMLEPLAEIDDSQIAADDGLKEDEALGDPEELLNDVLNVSATSSKKKKKKKKTSIPDLDQPVDNLNPAILDAEEAESGEPVPETEPSVEVKRPMTAAEKKKAKKERERLAKQEKARKEKEELDAIFAELGDGPSQANGKDDPPAEQTEADSAAPVPLTAAQKKRMKKKKKAAAEKAQDDDVEALMSELAPPNSSASSAQAGSGAATAAPGVDDLLAELGGDVGAPAAKKKAKKKKKKGGAKVEEDGQENQEAAKASAADTKKPKKKESAVVRRMREQQEKRLAEEERQRKEREAEEARIAEEERKRQEEIKKKEMEKAKKKAAEKARKERRRKEGTLLSKAEKERRRKAEQFRKQLEAQGLVPAATKNETGETRKRVVYENRRRKTRPSSSAPAAEKGDEKETAENGTSSPVAQVEEKIPAPAPEVVPDAWDEIEEVPEKEEAIEETNGEPEKNVMEQDESEDDSSDTDDSEYEGMTKAEIAAEKRLDALRRERFKLKEEARAARTVDRLRSPVICILGHVDTGKTKILDRIRKTNVQDAEAGGITQQIGATYFPIEAVKKEATKLQEGKKLQYNVPSLLIIDTPGHESFTNLRSRGSSLCDIAILVIDIMHGLEPQTRESIDLLKLRKTPFIVALNKIDRIYDWEPQPHNCPTRDSLSRQPKHAQEEFTRRANQAKLELAEIGFNTELYWENKDVRKFVSIVPTSAITGEGIPDLLMLLLALPQKLLTERLMWNPILEATVLEVKVIEGLGTTIDIILTGGTIHEGDTIMVVGLDGPIVTTIRALLTPHPMKEMRVKGQYLHHKKIEAAQGIKISADNLEKAVAGTQLMVVEDPNNEDEMNYVRDEVMKDFQTILTSVDRSGVGVYVQASTLGSLEALLEFLRTSKIPVSGINIGPVHKRDVTKASTMLEKRVEYATILAFDVNVEKEARELAEESGVRIFTADIIYHLFDQFTAYMEEVKRKRREDVNDDVVFPSISKILPQHVYNKKDPIIVGVDVMEGILRVGTPLVVKHGDSWLDVGRVASIELNKKQVVTAKKGESVAIKIQHKSTEHIMYGRHFDFQDMLVSKMSRSAIDLLKENFRDDLGKEEWILVIKLKKMFGIQ